jgi:hypothetical protein
MDPMEAQRIQEIDRAIEERKATLTPSVPMEWEEYQRVLREAVGAERTRCEAIALSVAARAATLRCQGVAIEIADRIRSDDES